MIPGIQDILDRWYISEPALLKVFFSHEFEINTSLSCPFRSGRGKIEYNPQIIETLNDKQLELFLKAESIRILLKHPYERQPDGCSVQAKSLGSNLVLADNYDFSSIGYEKPSAYNLPSKESFEWYSIQIERMLSKNSLQIAPDPEEKQQDGESSGSDSNNVSADNKQDRDQQEDSENTNGSSESAGNEGQSGENDFFTLKLADGSELRIPKSNRAVPKVSDKPDLVPNSNQLPNKPNRKFTFDKALKDIAETWGEDSLMLCSIDSMIEEIQASGKGWGTIPGNIVESILANTEAKIDYWKALSGFRASVLSSKRHLTRMRPNRRSGFDNMGSIRQLSTNLLVAVDVSGSVTSDVLRHFFSVIGRIFKYGIERVDVVQFDTMMGDVVSLEKAPKTVKILGRGGTNFQVVFDFAAKHPEYDGLIIFTDGYAQEPHKPKGMRTKVVWVCEDQQSYNAHNSWMKKTGRCCMMHL